MPHFFVFYTGGEKGYFRIRRGNDECGIESGVTVGQGDWFKRSTGSPAGGGNVTAPATNKWHYGDTDTGCRMGPNGNPPEEPIKIADLKDKETFSFCSTSCVNGTYPCNDDVPPGTTVKPACVIDMLGEEMCGLPCTQANEKTQCAYALGARCIMLRDSTQVDHYYCMWPDSDKAAH